MSSDFKHTLNTTPKICVINATQQASLQGTLEIILITIPVHTRAQYTKFNP